MTGTHGGVGIQGFIDSVHGSFFAIILHWVGAFAFTAGVILLGIFHAQRRRDPAWADRVPILPAILIVSGIVLNLTGGFMRLWVSDHPSLSEIMRSTWVQALLAKHGALILGMGASLGLLAASFPAVTSRIRVISKLLKPSRVEALLATAFIGVAAATIIGAMVTTIVTPAQSGEIAVATFAELSPADVSTERVVFLNFTGSITGTPVSAGRDEYSFVVPVGARQVALVVEWGNAAAVLDVVLTDPTGVEAEATKESTAGGVKLLAKDPGPGTWSVIVRSERAVSEVYRANVKIDVLQRASGHYEQTLSLVGGAATEIEVEIDPLGWLRYDYYAIDGMALAMEAHQDDNGAAAQTTPSSGRLNSEKGGHYGLVFSGDESGRFAVRLVGAFTLVSAPGAEPDVKMGEGHSHG